MATTTADKGNSIVVSALNARTNFGKLLRRVDVERRSLVIQKRGTPAAVSPEHPRLREACRPGAGRTQGHWRGGPAKSHKRSQFSPDRSDHQNDKSRKEEALMLALRLVIDTNVLVSAALKPDGLQRTTLLLAITKPARLYVFLSYPRRICRRACPPRACHSQRSSTSTPAVDPESRPSRLSGTSA